jgi:flagellar hook-length control protein FliK
LPQPTTPQVSIPPDLVLPRPTLTASAAAEPAPSKTDPRRAAVSGSPPNERPAKPDDTTTAAPSAVPPAGDVKPGPFTVSPEPAPGASMLAASSTVPQTISAAAGASPTASATPDQPVQSADRPAPVDQVAPALIGLLKTTDGTQSITMRLQPAELGQVEIRVEQSAQGTSHVAITAERPETLALLQHDEPRLQQALDQAGVSSSGRTVSFQVAPPPIDASASRPDSMATGSGGSGQSQSGGAWRQSSDQHNPGNGPGPEQGQAQTRWFRAGLDITA